MARDVNVRYETFATLAALAPVVYAPRPGGFDAYIGIEERLLHCVVTDPLDIAAFTADIMPTATLAIDADDAIAIVSVNLGMPTASNSVDAAVAQGIVSVTLFSANAKARLRWIVNNASNNGVLAVRWRALPASFTDGEYIQQIKKGESMFWRGDEYSGEVRGIWSVAGAGFASITETSS